MALECHCPDWAPNIAKVNAPLQLMHARNPHQGNMYRGLSFRYCPWCGDLLLEAEDRSVLQQKGDGE